MPAFLPPGFLPDGHIPEGHLPDSDEAASTDRTIIDVEGYYIPIKDPDEDLLLTFDWSGVLDVGLTLGSVVCTVLAPITKANEATDTTDATFDVDIGGMAVHAGLHVISMVATLSNGQTVSKDWPIRVFNS